MDRRVGCRRSTRLGQTVLLYSHGATITGSLLLIVLVVGFGYYVGQRLDFGKEYRRLSKAVAAGTTVPLVAAWATGAEPPLSVF